VAVVCLHIPCTIRLHRLVLWSSMNFVDEFGRCVRSCRHPPDLLQSTNPHFRILVDADLTRKLDCPRVASSGTQSSHTRDAVTGSLLSKFSATQPHSSIALPATPITSRPRPSSTPQIILDMSLVVAAQFCCMHPATLRKQSAESIYL
jgi:hypothetical protein